MRGLRADERRPFERQVVDVGRRLEIARRPGEPGRTPLLLCCGIGASALTFELLARALDPGRPLITFNAPGVGGSPEPRAPYTFATLSRSLRKAVTRFGYDRVDVLGISWGGALAQQFAFQNPRRCRRVVLVATHTGALAVPPSLRTVSRMMTPQRHRDPDYARGIAGELYGGSARTDPRGTVEVLSSARSGASGASNAPSFPSTRSYLYQLGAISGWTSLPALPLIRQRTLVLAGDDDPLVRPGNPRIMARLLPNSTLHIYNGGHLALLSHAEDLAPVIDAFLDAP